MTKGWVIIYMTVIITTALWILSGEFEYRFADPVSTLTSLGQLSGLIGMLFFAYSMILGSRAKILEKFFESMDLVYRSHHQLGGISFILLMIHPILLALAFVPISLNYAAHFLLPPISNYPVYFGIASMLFMMSFLILTFFVKLPYQLWKFTHKFMGLAFFLGGLHTFFVPSDVSRYLPLKIFMLIIVALSLLFYIYRTILGSLLVKKIKYQVVDIKQSGTIWEITLKPIGEKINFDPGQFAFISFSQKGISREYHPFSIASAPKEENIKFLVKSLGDYTRNLKKLTVGTTARIEGPYGKFSKRKKMNSDQVWIAGGIGIAPFMGMAKSIDLRNNNGSVDLYYCVNNEKEMASIDELTELSQTNPAFRMFAFCSDKYGKIGIKFINEMSANLKDREIYLCGPPAMMQSLRQQFRDIGVLNKHIHSEEFQFL